MSHARRAVFGEIKSEPMCVFISWLTPLVGSREDYLRKRDNSRGDGGNILGPGARQRTMGVDSVFLDALSRALSYVCVHMT
jgi:hypothetical protein